MSSRKAWPRLVQRAGEMTWQELRTRVRQEMAKRSDRMLNLFGWQLGPVLDRSLPDQCGRFFFEQPDVPTILNFLRRRLPDVVGRIINQAEQICQHRFDLLGYRDVDYGSRIDWHLDAVHGIRAPRRPWYKVRYLEFNQVGDSKVTWELNRHQHLVTLAKAYRLTGRLEFALEVFEQWYDWQAQNPYPIGINWASSLEVAMRSLSWLWVSHLFQDCAIVPAGFAADLRRALMLNGRHIARFLSTYFSPNTHLLGEGVGLFFIGTLCPGPNARRYQREGWRIVLEEARRQVRPDGVHFEHSTYYHTYALDFFLHARVLAGLNGIPIPAEFDKTIQNMLEVIRCLSLGGSVPRLGDDDGGRVFDPGRNRVEHMVDPLALGAVLFNRDYFKIADTAFTEEAAWLTGIKGVSRFDQLRGKSESPRSFAMKPTGIHVMGSSGRGAQQLTINGGPAQPGRQGHRHADVLSVQLNINGHPVLVDPGTFVYVDPDRERDQFRGTFSHNSVQVDGLDQGEPDGPFGWRGLRPAEVSRWATGSTFDCFEGTHTGYRRLQDPVEHRRFIFHLKPDFWLVRDILSGAGVHDVGVNWHFSRGYLANQENGFTFLDDNQAALGLTFGSSHPWSHDICSWWYSPVYGTKEPAPALRSTTTAMLPLELVTLLSPVSSNSDKLGVLELLVAESGTPSVRAYRHTSAGAPEYLFVFASSEEWRLGPWSGDAMFFFAAGGRDGRPDRFVLCDGSYLFLNGRRILLADARLEYAEFFFEGKQPRLRCSNADAVRIGPPGEENLLRDDLLAAV